MKDLGFSEEFSDVHGIFLPENNNIQMVYENSFHFDFNSLNKKFDLIFVDGDHSYEGVKNDTMKVAELKAKTAEITIPIKLVICPLRVGLIGKAMMMAMIPIKMMLNKTMERINVLSDLPLVCRSKIHLIA